MKKITRYQSLSVLFFFFALNGIAQNIKAPVVWFSFNGTTPLVANYSNVQVQINSSASQISYTVDRFGNSLKAIGFPNKQSALIVADASGNQGNVKLFGYSDNATNLPDSFTISCWVYVEPKETPVLARKIFFTDNDNSRFALIHKGAQIYLRRTVRNETTATDNRFDYLFGEPASFDAGTGWYQVILVMGKRAEDAAKYCKLYVGKPHQVKYDSDTPRIVTAPADVLAADFGGSYAFTGVQDFMNTNVTAWGLGNADDNDPVHGTSIASVKQMDDFSVWDTTITDLQARNLFYCQREHPADQCWNTPNLNAGAAKKVQPPMITTDLSAEKAVTGIRVFPNPTSGEVWVQLPADATSGTTSLTLTDLNGKVLYLRTVTAGKTGQSVQLNVKSITKTNGIYLLQLSTPDQIQTFKIIVQ